MIYWMLVTIFFNAGDIEPRYKLDMFYSQRDCAVAEYNARTLYGSTYDNVFTDCEMFEIYR